MPAATEGSTLDVHVGGQTAIVVDLADTLGTRLPFLFLAVLLLSFLLLMVVFRSLLVPLKAVVMNLLSIGAAYGVIVAIFQWGWIKDVVGIGKEGPIEAWAPMMLFAIVFGLSMDYEVFLLSRIKEEYDRTHDNADAVADGLAVTARLITAAAAIMICVFGSFVLGPRVLKLFGFGLAFAVFIDATIVRLLLVPATMELLGDRNWWFPKWLEWLPARQRRRHARSGARRTPKHANPNRWAGRSSAQAVAYVRARTGHVVCRAGASAGARGPRPCARLCPVWWRTYPPSVLLNGACTTLMWSSCLPAAYGLNQSGYTKSETLTRRPSGRVIVYAQALDRVAQLHRDERAGRGLDPMVRGRVADQLARLV